MTQKNNNHHEKKTRHEIFSEKDSQIASYNIDMTQPNADWLTMANFETERKKTEWRTKRKKHSAKEKQQIFASIQYTYHTHSVFVCVAFGLISHTRNYFVVVSVFSQIGMFSNFRCMFDSAVWLFCCSNTPKGKYMRSAIWFLHNLIAWRGDFVVWLHAYRKTWHGLCLCF